jgi:hypothetical protein
MESGKEHGGEGKGIGASLFPSKNGPFPQSVCQSSGLLVRRATCTPPRNPLCLDPIPLSCGIVLDLAQNCSFLNWKLTLVPIILRLICGWALAYLVVLSVLTRLRILCIETFAEPRLAL